MNPAANIDVSQANVSKIRPSHENKTITILMIESAIYRIFRDLRVLNPMLIDGFCCRSRYTIGVETRAELASKALTRLDIPRAPQAGTCEPPSRAPDDPGRTGDPPGSDR
ncbi:hypothetical protein RRG08_020567 [Elysia crispata]|uniref:Uncharacterized protein n=1 Tax=Elysia crispata TaxID=231223 RepID=A0AAE1DTL8_9GAST|nr:hypothetical protein RRG08_020567 [Elysia crispata]